MAAPVGLDQEAVFTAALELLAEHSRVENLGMRQVAERLGVRTQSLYAHVNGAEGLRRGVAMRGLALLTEELTTASIGRSGPDAIAAIVRAYLSFALDNAALFDTTLRVPADDPDLAAAMTAAMRPLNLVLASMGLNEVEAAHWYRIILATIHGYSVLRRGRILTMPADPDDTIDRIVAMFSREVALKLDQPLS